MGRRSDLIDDEYWSTLAGVRKTDGQQAQHGRENRDFAVDDPLGFENVGDDHHVYRPETLDDLITTLERVRDEEFDGDGDVKVSSIKRIHGVDAVRTGLTVDWGVDSIGEDRDGEVLVAPSDYLPLERESGDGFRIALDQGETSHWSHEEVDDIVAAIRIAHMTDPRGGNVNEYNRLKDEAPDTLRLARIADGILSREVESDFADLTDDDLARAAEQALRVSNE